MNPLRFSLTTLALYCCIGHSCSQQSETGSKLPKRTFEATTPCSEPIKVMLGIPANFNCEMIKWDLNLFSDDKNHPAGFHLIYTYGVGKPGTRGFKEGAGQKELKGRWTIEKLNSYHIVSLIDNSSSMTLSFLQPGRGLLHLLHKDKELVNGTAAWSYTLNETNPSPPAGKFTSRFSSSMPGSNSDTVGIFYGRTPCNKTLRAINNISAEGCGIIKCKLVLLQDTTMHVPTTFIIQTIYVGNGDDNKYTVKGSWKQLQGTADNPTAVVYQLLPEGKPENQLLLLKADNNILYFLDNGTNLQIGNSYSSYTLNRGK